MFEVNRTNYLNNEWGKGKTIFGKIKLFQLVTGASNQIQYNGKIKIRTNICYVETYRNRF